MPDPHQHHGDEEDYSAPNAWRDSSDPLSDPEEQRVLLSTLDSFRQYRRSAHYTTTHRRRQNLYALPEPQLNLLISPPFSLLDKLSDIDDAVDINADLADAILARGLQTFDIPSEVSSIPGPNSGPFGHHTSAVEQHNKAHSTIRQFYRDWTTEGFTAEVKPLLDLVLSALETNGFLPCPTTSILHPGAGLGRFLFELILAGYSATGNEISYHQLLGSDFILNTTPHADSYTIYPFISTFNNNVTRSKQLRSYTVPDIHPATALAEVAASGKAVGEMGMAAGDFITSFSDPDSATSFEAVVTLYFIDTAPNLIRYIETIKHCLKPNGLWINVGPLLWHFDNQQGKDKQHQHEERRASKASDDGRGRGDASPAFDDARAAVGPELQQASQRRPDFVMKNEGIAEPGSLELADDEVLTLLSAFGFQILEHKILPESMGGYIQDPDSMLQNRYRNSFWVVRKTEQGDELDI